MHSFTHNLFKITLSLLTATALFSLLAVDVQALSYNQVLRDKDFAYLPAKFSSAQQIQSFLESENSVLATYSVEISFHEDENPNNCDSNDTSYLKGYADCKGDPDDTDIMISPYIFSNKPQRFVPFYATQPHYGSTMKVSEFIWELARGDLNNGCSFGSDGVCIDNTKKPINPAFVLAIIQKESGLVYGSGAQAGSYVNGQSVAFRMDRATGYTCYETSDRSKSCWDENPSWKYFKGFFRQVYYSTRWFRVWTERCDMGSQYGHQGTFYTGNTVTIDGQSVYLSNGITCAMYIYTPHLSLNTANILTNIGGGEGFIEENPRGPQNPPSEVYLF